MIGLLFGVGLKMLSIHFTSTKNEASEIEFSEASFFVEVGLGVYRLARRCFAKDWYRLGEIRLTIERS